MGLDCSHGAFNGPYGAFNRLRQAVCRAIGGSFPPHEDPTLNHEHWYFDRDVLDLNTSHRGVRLFLAHSDCDGNFTAEECAIIARDLRSILPLVRKVDDLYRPVCGQPASLAVEKFAAGCERAAGLNQDMWFS